MNSFQHHVLSSLHVASLATALLCFTAHTAQRPVYEVTDLGKLPGGGYPAVAANINNAGQIVGYALGSNFNYRAFISENGVMRDLGVGTNSSFAGQLNEVGQITGDFRTDWDPITLGRDHAFLYASG